MTGHTEIEKDSDWGRLPNKPGERLCGLSRAHIYEKINDGTIRSACIRKPGRIKGIRLVFLPSVRAYIEKHAE